MAPSLGSTLVLSSLLTCLPLLTNAHMQMSWPYPLRSPLDPDVPYYDKDYSMTSPLLADGSDFSCKHYQFSDTYDQANVIKATYYAGNTYNMSIAGTAVHNGGSCQLSLSYDNGETFKVIKSMIGGCPITLTYDFTIPSFAPVSDSVLLSWSWFNLAGNREMYQNCARVRIASNPSQKYRRGLWTRQSSMSELPDMFVCNVDNGCTTIEGSEVVFPDPGNDVVYGQDLVAANPGPGFTTSGVSSSTTSAAGSGSGASATTSTSSNTGTSSPASVVASTTTSAVYVSSTDTVSSSTSTASATQISVTTPAQFYTTSNASTLEPTTSTPPYPFSNGTTTSTGFFLSGTGLPSTTGFLIVVTGGPVSFSATSASSSSSSSLSSASSSGSSSTLSSSTSSSTSSSSSSTSSSTSTSSDSSSSASAFTTTSGSTSTMSTIGPISTSSSTFSSRRSDLNIVIDIFLHAHQLLFIDDQQHYHLNTLEFEFESEFVLVYINVYHHYDSILDDVALVYGHDNASFFFVIIVVVVVVIFKSSFNNSLDLDGVVYGHHDYNSIVDDIGFFHDHHDHASVFNNDNYNDTTFDHDDVIYSYHRHVHDHNNARFFVFVFVFVFLVFNKFSFNNTCDLDDLDGDDDVCVYVCNGISSTDGLHAGHVLVQLDLDILPVRVHELHDDDLRLHGFRGRRNAVRRWVHHTRERRPVHAQRSDLLQRHQRLLHVRPGWVDRHGSRRSRDGL
ncbi:hypothetical protein PV08_08042 [Exophiala spinifera]|uniref:Chitin-binding type-4 domain-containing protein n=1 Tax=Exophiala spinifera TaxID=91928 RepID=A0A0D2B2L7_9EURO|nr:uncharacterized protein PV08_08042 [Exophiala spinifera]KIW12855.1 hypothetical protein PV08_08042 [Exophiala spinifera]